MDNTTLSVTKRYPTSKERRLQLQWWNRLLLKKSSAKKVAVLSNNCCQKWSVPRNPRKNGWLQKFREINSPTWKNGRLKQILQKKPVCLKEWMADHNSLFQIKWHAVLQNGRIQVVLPLQGRRILIQLAFFSSIPYFGRQGQWLGMRLPENLRKRVTFGTGPNKRSGPPVGS